MANILLSPFNLGQINLSNRIVMAPMTRSRATNADSAANDIMATYYGQRASASLIIAEASQISKRGIGYINTPGIYTEAQVKGWKTVTDNVHKNGGKIFLQIWHVGRISHTDFHDGLPPLAPSAITAKAMVFTAEGMKETSLPAEMSKEDISETVKDFRVAARNAIQAGFDGVEIHASNGYLIHQFFNNTSNRRIDEYGGSHENKTRFLFEVLEGIKNEVPENKIGIRLHPSLDGIFGMDADEDSLPTIDYLVERLNTYDLAYLHITEPANDITHKPYLEKEVVKRYRAIYKGVIIANGDMNVEKANDYLMNGWADLIAFGRPFIANPDLVYRIQSDAPWSDFNQDTLYTPGPEGLIDYKTIDQTLLEKKKPIIITTAIEDSETLSCDDKGCEVLLNTNRLEDKL